MTKQSQNILPMFHRLARERQPGNYLTELALTTRIHHCSGPHDEVHHQINRSYYTEASSDAPFSFHTRAKTGPICMPLLALAVAHFPSHLLYIVSTTILSHISIHHHGFP